MKIITEILEYIFMSFVGKNSETSYDGMWNPRKNGGNEKNKSKAALSGLCISGKKTRYIVIVPRFYFCAPYALEIIKLRGSQILS